jgi:hypothetical protein
MRGCTSSFGCLIYIFITFWVLLFSIIFISSAQWLFDREFYSETFTNDALIDAVYDDALPRIYNDNVFFRQVDGEDLSNQAFGDALREIAPKEYVVNEINQIIDAIISYAQGDVTRLDYRLNTQVIRDNLNNSTRASAFAQALVARLPACEGVQTYYGKSPLPACLPAGVTNEQFVNQVTGNLSALTSSIPNEIDLFDAPRRSADIPTFNLSDISQTTTQIVMIVAGIVLFITASMGANGLRSLLRRMSIMLLIPATLMIWGSGIINDLETSPSLLTNIEITLNDRVIREGPLVDATEEVLGDIVGRVANDTNNTSLVALAIAGVLFFLSLLPMPGSGRGLDSTLNLPPSGKVGHMTSNHNSPIQGI